MRAFVTGGTGLVGRPFVRRLLRDGWTVMLATRDAARGPAEASDALTVRQLDLSDAAALGAVAREVGRVDVVFHLAASLDYFGEFAELLRANVACTRNVLDLAVATGARRFVYASSIEAVGPVTAANVPARAGTECRPVSSYGESKRRAEALVTDYRNRGLSTHILRIGNVYADDHYSFVMDVVAAILQHGRLLEFLPVYADRCIQPVHTDDVTTGLLAAAVAQVPAATVVLADRHVTIGALFQLCGGLLERRVFERAAGRGDHFFLDIRRRWHRYRKQMDFITYLMNGAGSRVHRAYSVDDAARDLGFQAEISLRDGVERTLRWHRQAGVLDRLSA